jgi:hypothetical protein
MANPKPKLKKRGRPRMAKEDAKGKIVPVRFELDDYKLVTAAAKVGKQTLSAWIRHTLRTAAEVQMFDGMLHKAMMIVLWERDSRTATTREISNEIERRQLYLRKDGETARAKQINARVRQYPELFRFIEPGLVQLVGNSSAVPE